MGFSIKKDTKEQDFSKNLKGIKVPLLVLDQKWHHLFTGSKKTDAILKLEKHLTELLGQQGRAQQELKELKKLKSTLMQNIVENMEGAALFALAEAEGVPCGEIRAISNYVGEERDEWDIPLALDRLTDTILNLTLAEE